jgi:hypothetical protein
MDQSSHCCPIRLIQLLLTVAALVAAITLPHPVPAQTFDATTLSQPSDLSMTWLATTGDDPAWARPDFDDSHWMAIDPHKSLRLYLGEQMPNVVWYRLHVKVAPGATGLGLAEYRLAGAFEIYVNGRRVMKVGEVSPFKPSIVMAHLLTPISDEDAKTGTLVIALRVHVTSGEWSTGYPGLFPGNVIFGQQSALSNQTWLTVLGGNVVRWFYEVAALGLGLVGLALFVAQRSQREYLWLALFGISTGLNAPLAAYENFYNLPFWSVYIGTAFDFAIVLFQTLMFMAFLRLPLQRWMRVLLGLMAVGMFLYAIQNAAGWGTIPSLVVALIPEVVVIAGVVPVLLFIHWRRGNREAGILLLPVLIFSFAIYTSLTGALLMAIPGLTPVGLWIQETLLQWQIDPFVIQLYDLDNCLYLFSLTIIIVLRTIRIARHQAQVETELAAAREVQRIVIPAQIESVPGLEMDTAYEPAQQVGGDFFQIVPVGEGSVLVIIGDVAGKGLPAAMLVSVLVGAIRAAAQYTSDPAELLANLNERLAGRASGGFSTALASRIDPDGTVTVANAGHPSPYLDGEEIELAGALPLGITAGTRYETKRLHMPRGSRILFYSDGIVEAQNARRELFGFERTRKLSAEPVAKIVESARLFGQQDDMTAISITRVAEAGVSPVLEMATA